MIKYQGEINQNNKKVILKRQALLSLAISLTIATLLGIVVIIFCLLSKNYIFLILLLLFYLIAVLAALPPSKNKYDLIFPNAVVILDDTITSYSDKFEYSRHLTQVKKVIDYKEFYQIHFVFPYKNLTFICQKNLLVNGTIADFEKIFEGKIVRKSI